MKLVIEKLIYRGLGVGDVDGKLIFVPFSAPDDDLEVEVVEDHGSYAEARIREIIEPSPCRVKPPCPVFGICGGCQWQHLSYETQLEWKRKILIETLRRIGKLEISEELVKPTLRSPKEWHYRNRIQLHVDSKSRIGFYKAKSKEVVEFKECLIAEEELNKKLNEMRPQLKGRDKGIALRKESGPSFTQINTAQNEQLKNIIVEWLREIPHDIIVELYAGAGNFTFSLAALAKEVVASDIDGRSIKLAKAEQEHKKIKNIEFFCEEALKTIKRSKTPPDALVLDPPRKGAIEVMDTVLTGKPRSILYISCDPATLARDLAKLALRGYKLVQTMPVDMFPQTYHIESISLLSFY